jgi:hypothetical protein
MTRVACEELLKQRWRLLDWIEGAEADAAVASLLLHALQHLLAEAADLDKAREVYEEVRSAGTHADRV